MLKILLDECLDWRLARDLNDYEVTSVSRMGWNGIKNGDLLVKAQDHFDVFITTDRNLSFQQSLPKFKIAVIVLAAPSNRLEDLQLLVSKLRESLSQIQLGTVTTISSN